MVYYAHTKTAPDGSVAGEQEWQPLRDHLSRVANLARQFAIPLGFPVEAELAGLLHDFGKYRDEFQAYLRGERLGGAETQHAIYGAAWAYTRAQLGSAFGVAGHHTGLHDMADLQSSAGRSTVQNALPSIEQRFKMEIGALPEPPGCPPHVINEHAAELYTRLLFSCLVDADRLDTAFWPQEPPSDQPLEVEKLLACVQAERHRKRTENPTSPLSALRNQVFDACVAAGARPQGFFSLTVPTGGGKTLSSMAFALAHAKQHGLRRVIVVIPYLSIIEQNAAEYRRMLGDDVVLENHSAVEPRVDIGEEEKDRLELISENWDAPVVVTTSVQFLESLFASSPSRCRKLHRIPQSVVIFDEVQTLPAHLLQPVFSIFRELQRNYGVSFVFSSATQPAFRKCSSLPDGFAPDELREIAANPSQLFRDLRRVNYHLPGDDETLDWSQLAEKLAAGKQALCVVNLVRHAATLWEELKKRLPTDERPIHLSAAMYPQHRFDTLMEIRARLKAGQPCRVIATQLIEAGVDVDFPFVWRALGPLDSIVQVAGRCNREGRPVPGEMHVFRPVDHKLPGDTYPAATGQTSITLNMLARRGNPAELLGTDPDVFGDYFQSLWQIISTDYARRGETSIQEDRTRLRFREVSRKAKVIPDSGQPVIIYHNAGKKVVDEIRTRILPVGQPRFTREDLRRLQRFMVNVRTHKFQLLLARQNVKPLLPNLELYVLDDGFYHPDLGLVIDNRPLEDFIQ